MKNYKILQTTEEALFNNKEMTKIYTEVFGLASLMQLNAAAVTRVLNFMFHTCQKKNILTAKVKVFVNCTTLHAFKNCVSNLKQLACHLYHPVCFAQNHTITSPVCHEACNNNMQRSCSSVQHSFFEVIKLMIDYCPAETVDFDQPFRLLEDCGNFPPVHMKYIHRCQLISSPDLKNNTEKCFNGKGEYYNGTVSITATGKSCLYWDVIPFLNLTVYNNLHENFCRNPQSYGKMPWCYVDQEQNWEYCNIISCEELWHRKNKAKESLSTFAIGAVATGSCLTIFIIILSILYIRRKRKRQEQPEEIEPYTEVTVQTSAQIQAVLQLKEMTINT